MQQKIQTSLIDGDVLLYRFGFSGQTKIYFDENPIVKVEEEEEVFKRVDDFIKKVTLAADCITSLIAFSSSTNFRKIVDETYKVNRKPQERPVLYYKIKNHIIENYSYIMLKDLEADDVLGLLQTDKTVICTIDKDLDTIPGKHYNWNKEKKYITTKEESLKKLYTQALIGDNVDNIKGCPGIGPKRAEKILKDLVEEKEMFEACIKAYENKGLCEEDLIKTMRLVYILHNKEDYNHQTKEVKLWTRPN